MIVDGSTPSGRSPLPVSLVDEVVVPCGDGRERRHLNLDSAASTNALPEVARRVEEFVPWYSSVHRGAGYMSRHATQRYEQARTAALGFAGRPHDGDDIAIVGRNTTEAINHLAYRLRLSPDDSIVTTVIERHANSCRGRGCASGVTSSAAGTALSASITWSRRWLGRPPRLLAITGASNVTGWLPPPGADLDPARAPDVAAAKIAPPTPVDGRLPGVERTQDVRAPFGARILLGPRSA